MLAFALLDGAATGDAMSSKLPKSLVAFGAFTLGLILIPVTIALLAWMDPRAKANLTWEILYGLVMFVGILGGYALIRWGYRAINDASPRD